MRRFLSSVPLYLKILIAVTCSIVIMMNGILDFFIYLSDSDSPVSIIDIKTSHNHTYTYDGNKSNNGYSAAKSLTSTKDAQCSKIISALDISSWSKVMFYKDRQPNSEDNYIFLSNKFSSLEEDNKHARKTINDFNKLRSSVLTSHLLNEGLIMGNNYLAHTLANRFIESSSSNNRPLNVAVFGSSFTIGSNCGESSGQVESDCAWPGRLAQRWEELMNVSVTWRHFEENAQNSANIGQKIPSILDEYNSKNITPDVILLDNTITDVVSSFAWYEAIIRVFVTFFPNAVIITLIDAIPRLVDHSDDDWANRFYKRLYQIQQHYDHAIIDIAKIVAISKNQLHNVTNYTTEDLIWPQSLDCVSSDGTKYRDFDCDQGVTPIFFDNFLPLTRKTKIALYPENHPPWPTHQYVADSVMYTLLKLVEKGLGCGTDEFDSFASLPPMLPNTTVFSKAEIDHCSICLSPITRFDARVTKYVSQANVNDNGNNDDDDVVVTCGDWKWVTDERNRSGWQSNELGSVIRFRLKISEEPTISLTYMRSYENFGDLKVTFRILTKEDKNLPLWGCDDFDKLNFAPPLLQLEGFTLRFSLWETAVFPAKIDDGEVNAYSAWELLNQTVLSKMSSDVEFVDMYVVNPNDYAGRSRIKIQTVTSC